MTPTTPSGWYSTEAAWLASTRVPRTRRGPSTLAALRAAQSRCSTIIRTSMRASASGLPFSRWTRATSSSVRRTSSAQQASRPAGGRRSPARPSRAGPAWPWPRRPRPARARRPGRWRPPPRWPGWSSRRSPAGSRALGRAVPMHRGTALAVPRTLRGDRHTFPFPATTVASPRRRRWTTPKLIVSKRSPRWSSAAPNP